MIALHDMRETAFEMPEEEAFQLSPDTVFCQKGKKLFDILVPAILLFPVLPLMGIIALAIKLDSKGPALFSQRRLGKGGKPFIIYKFRTMNQVACHADDATQATCNDPRITRVGHFLRRSSLDELPQLWNVLRGDMSLIGPRPHAVVHDIYFSQHVSSYWKRYAVKPGLTGWAQINGWRGETPEIRHMAARVAYDMDYIASRTWIMDIKIALKTLYVMMFPSRSLR